MTEEKTINKIFKVIKKVFDIITDVIIYPIIIVSIIIGLNSMVTKQQNDVKSIFGYTIVTVLSGSMLAAGFEIDDVVFLKPFNVKDLRPGMVIAFYNCFDSGDPSEIHMTRISDFDNPPEATTTQKVTGSKTRADAVAEKDFVLFHRIINVFVAADGTRFFETKGDSNSTADVRIIREEFVVGQYLYTPEVVRSALTFMSSVNGIIYIVIIPLSILVFFQIIEVMKIVFDIMTEKKVLSGEIRFDCEESIKAKVGIEMMDYNKVYFYDISPPKDKVRVFDFLWAFLNTEKSTEKEKLKYKQATYAKEIHSKSRDEYWNYWLSKERKHKYKNKLLHLQKVADILCKSTKVEIANNGTKLPARPIKKVEDPAVLEIKEKTKTIKNGK